MKATVLFALFLASLNLTGHAAVSNSVGYVTFTVDGLSLIGGARLEQLPEYTGNIVSVSDNGDGTADVTLQGASFTASEFQAVAGAVLRYLRINGDGTLSGNWFTILENTATTVTIDTAGYPDVSVLTDGTTNTGAVHPFPSLANMFPDGTVNPGPTGDLVLTFAGASGSIGSLFTNSAGDAYDDDSVEASFYFGNGQWYDAETDQVVSENTAFAPDQPIGYDTNGGTAEITIVGQVPEGRLSTPLERGTNERDNILVNMLPVDVSLNQFGIHNASAFKHCTDPLTLQSAEGDGCDIIIIPLDGGGTRSYVYHDGTNPGFATGYLDVADPWAGDQGDVAGIVKNGVIVRLLGDAPSGVNPNEPGDGVFTIDTTSVYDLTQ